MIFYITFDDLKGFSGTGIEKKIDGQIEAMEYELGEICLIWWSYPVVYLTRKKRVIEKEPAVTRKDCINAIICWIQKYNVQMTYIRYPISSKWFIDLLEFQKKRQIKTVVEIATYPYDDEIKYRRTKLEDRCYRKEIAKYVDILTTYSSDNEIWGIPCIKLVNGINLKNIRLSQKERDKNKIVLIAVSSMQFWHGYERILEGMQLYYKIGGKYDFVLKMVGIGPEEQKYRKYVEKYGLTSHVEFLGCIETNEQEKLDKQFELSDIGVDSLGMYKKGGNEGSGIKGAEYCARGIPAICGYHDLRFPNNWKYIMNVSNNSEPIDMNRVIKFYENITLENNYKKNMRNYAEEHLTWENIMKPVVEYFKNSEKP